MSRAGSKSSSGSASLQRTEPRAVFSSKNFTKSSFDMKTQLRSMSLLPLW